MGLIVHSQAPFNAEPPMPRLRSRLVTPQQDLYVRCHGDVPRLGGGGYRLRVGTAELTLEALRRLPERHVPAVLQCAGNRRADLQSVRRTSGDPWTGGAIGNAVWTGVPLGEVLRTAGAPIHPGLHVVFQCHDRLPCAEGGGAGDGCFGVSIPMAKAMAPETLLAYAVNGETLTPEHGFPLRAVVPGFAGVRSAKWLAAIHVQDQPSANPMQASHYKLFPPDVTEQTADAAAGITIEEMPLNSAICEPENGAVLPAGQLALRGYAVASAGRCVARVDVSADRGGSWTQAVLERLPDAPWSWVFWTAAMALPPGRAELAVRAWDSAGQTQPCTAAEVWNLKGYLCTAWHRVSVLLQ